MKIASMLLIALLTGLRSLRGHRRPRPQGRRHYKVHRTGSRQFPTNRLESNPHPRWIFLFLAAMAIIGNRGEPSNQK